MNSASDKLDLRRIGETAFTEVLTTLWSLSATVRESEDHHPFSTATDAISSRVLLTGPRVSGSVHLRLPQAFVASAVRRLTGLEGEAGNSNELQDDAAAELVNMVAGQVARRLAAEGYPGQLGTPSVSRSARLAAESREGMAVAGSTLICEGHCLTLEIQCCYTDP